MALAEVFEQVAGPDAPVGFRAYDGSSTGAADSPVTITVRSPIAVSYLAQAPGAHGAGARLRVRAPGRRRRHVHRAGPDGPGPADRTSAWPSGWPCCAGSAGRSVLLPPGPAAAAGGPGQPALADRPAALAGPRRVSAISHHYDVSNTFYEWVLGPSMAYTCACYPSPDATLEQAQAHKFDLVARKLGAAAGDAAARRRLRLGRHGDARRAGVRRPRPRRHAVRASRPAGRSGPSRKRACPDLAEVRHLDYREVTEDGFDAVSSIGLTEHIGKAQLPGYFAFLYGKLRPQRPAAQPLHHPAGQQRADQPPRRVHLPVRVPRRRAGGARPT